MNQSSPSQTDAGDRTLHVSCDATMDQLPRLLSLADSACAAANADEAACYAVRLAVEEIVVNIVSYGYPEGSPGPVDLALAWDEQQMTLKISDRAACFSPEDAPDPDLESDWNERAVGGLGWHLVRSLVDEVQHRYQPGCGNEYTLIKRFAR